MKKGIDNSIKSNPGLTGEQCMSDLIHDFSMLCTLEPSGKGRDAFYLVVDEHGCKTGWQGEEIMFNNRT